MSIDRLQRRGAPTRRELLQKAGSGLGSLALATMLAENDLFAHPVGADGQGRSPLAPRPSHFLPRAKSVIFLFMYGGPSHLDLFDYKPALAQFAGKGVGEVVDTKGARSGGGLFPSPYKFARHGESGHWVSDRYPHLAGVIDHTAMLRGVYGHSISHAPALFEVNTGMIRTGFPSLGSWVTYGLGSENQDLPGFVVMYDYRGGPIGGAPNWGSGFLPGAFQGTPVRSRGTPILNLQRPAGLEGASQRQLLDYAAQVNRGHRARHPAETALEARIESFELAYRMQTAAPEALALARATAATRRLYGIEKGNPGEYFGTQCLMARRLVERGVRFVQLYSGGGHGDDNWDAHGSITGNHNKHCAATDQPMAGLLQDLAQRGLLEETLVVWGGEFGRTPHKQGGSGRDHHPFGFTMWMAGGGVKGGTSYGETDEVGYHAAVDRTSIHDVHATILQLLGMNHEELTYHFSGRDFRLTDVAGNVIHQILA
ncbi:MAG: DUF1501 domain-containing protein [Planctomycetota bacterium]|nr:DUF1501 domain-containing protein [Planctomycetota bacterium]